MGVNLRRSWRLKPQLHKHAPACAGFIRLNFSLVRLRGLGFYSRDFQSLGLKLTSMRLVNLEENQKLLGQTNPVLLNGTKRLSQFLVQNKILKQEVDPKPLLDDRLVRNLKHKG